ncbi:MAG: MmgE/PrpD family protein [Betaproteobacteria bacterium]|nr:MmgE/PrpD family protein [Betaproteobacteria bacterium]
MDRPTRHLIEFTLDSRGANLGARIVHECKRRLIDSIGCAIGAFNDQLCVTLRQMARDYPGPQGATLWGTADQTSPEMAAFCNGVMVPVQDYNDTYFVSTDGAHPSDMIPALFAVAEAVRADGRSLIVATATAYEIMCRFMQSVDVSARNYDQPLYASAATALAAGQLMGLSAPELAHALALAVTPNLPLRQTRNGELSHWKGCATADGTRKAIFAANLASRGVTGPSDIFEGKQGMWSVLGAFDWAATAEWPAMAMVGSTYLKNLPVCYHAQAAAQAAIQLHPAVRGKDIEAVEIATYDEAVRMIGTDPTRWRPRSRETADHSLPFIAATCLTHGAVDASSFDREMLDKPELVELMQKIRVTPSPPLTALYPKTAPARVVVRTRNGETLAEEVHFPKGHSADPMNDAEIEEKFTRLCRVVCGEGAAASTLSGLWDIDRCPDAASVMPKLAEICTVR